MKLFGRFATFFALLLLVTAPLYAQNGCVDSPESPTLVLGAIGGAYAFYRYARTRVSNRNR